MSSGKLKGRWDELWVRGGLGGAAGFGGKSRMGFEAQSDWT